MFYPCSKNKGADQLCSYCEADLRLCFHLCKNLTTRLIRIFCNSDKVHCKSDNHRRWLVLIFQVQHVEGLHYLIVKTKGTNPSTFVLLIPKEFQASSYLLCVLCLACFESSLTPRKQIFSQKGSFNNNTYQLCPSHA